MAGGEKPLRLTGAGPLQGEQGPPGWGSDNGALRGHGRHGQVDEGQRRLLDRTRQGLAGLPPLGCSNSPWPRSGAYLRQAPRSQRGRRWRIQTD